jgi:hypothetical protein
MQLSPNRVAIHQDLPPAEESLIGKQHLGQYYAGKFAAEYAAVVESFLHRLGATIENAREWMFVHDLDCSKTLLDCSVFRNGEKRGEINTRMAGSRIVIECTEEPCHNQ